MVPKPPCEIPEAGETVNETTPSESAVLQYGNHEVHVPFWRLRSEHCQRGRWGRQSNPEFDKWEQCFRIFQLLQLHSGRRQKLRPDTPCSLELQWSCNIFRKHELQPPSEQHGPASDCWYRGQQLPFESLFQFGKIYIFCLFVPFFPFFPHADPRQPQKPLNVPVRGVYFLH